MVVAFVLMALPIPITFMVGLVAFTAIGVGGRDPMFSPTTEDIWMAYAMASIIFVYFVSYAAALMYTIIKRRFTLFSFLPLMHIVLIFVFPIFLWLFGLFS